MLCYVPIAATMFIIAASANPLKGQKQGPGSLIIRGEDTKIEDHPHQVALQYRGSFICGGSIISKYYVLTAAHCLEPFEARDLTIRSGSTYRTSGGKIHKIKSMVIHKDYYIQGSGIPVHDIGWIRVTEAFTMKPIRMFRSNENTKPNEVAVTTGWGKTHKGTLPNVLQMVTISIVDRNACIKAYEPLGVPKGQICAGGYKGVCHGDSGGPLTVKGRLAGITSWGSDCGNSKYPNVYTEVAYYYKWIRNNTRQ